ncbi:hypothetical protein L2E82_05899 [Cichorium intybus]|uniref:Uncharacterized protein n=1 Tax=Cichorium intybus TaxID=13427 RepID=A0ACB9H8G2_CICIN|nr:hypothetical protein L2E82_05899 [Cichorium intybus]
MMLGTDFNFTLVVESPCDSAAVPDGAPLSIYQCFQNVRNFLVATGQLGLPTFEPSDLEQGGKSSKIVNCIVELKSYSEWKQTGIPPFNAESPQQIFGNIMNRDIPWPKIPEEMSFEAYDLINKLTDCVEMNSNMLPTDHRDECEKDAMRSGFIKKMP